MRNPLHLLLILGLIVTGSGVGLLIADFIGRKLTAGRRMEYNQALNRRRLPRLLFAAPVQERPALAPAGHLATHWRTT